MKRSDFLFCAGIELSRFKLLRQRGQLPFVVNGESVEHRGGNYTLAQAFQMRLMLDLLGGEGDEAATIAGLSPSYAVTVVSEAVRLFPRHPLNQIEPFDWYLGVAVFEKPYPNAVTARFSEPFGFELAHLSTWLQDRCKPDNRGVATTVVRLFMVNVTRAAIFVEDRAIERGLPHQVVFADQSQTGVKT